MPTPDDLLFADHVVKAGFLTQEEVQESLSVQKRMEEMGVPESLRNVLVKRGVLREADAAVVARNAGLRSGGEPIRGYTLEARIGTGAMGSVYRALQKGMKRHVAIKILRRDLTDDPRQVERLQREAALVGRLDHPNIVRGLDSGETDGLVWFVMELVEGETLKERISRLQRLTPDEAIRITRQIAEALEHANTLGVVHRDVKPGNILVARDGTPRLTDYGLAKGESDDALTQLDATLGTPQYISPEQAKNPRDADIRSDIYSLGATLYAMLTGHPPFAGETMAATLTKVLYERPKPVTDEAPDTPPALAYVVERMMAKDRRHRYQTPADLLHDLRALEEGKLVVPHGFKGDIGEFVETRRHRRLWMTGAALLVLAGAAAASVLAWERHTADDRRRQAAAHELASLRQVAGPTESWTGDTVQKMVDGLEHISRDYAGTPAADEALVDLRHWAAQRTELVAVQDLALRGGDPQADMPKVFAEAAERLKRIRVAPDAGVATARLTALVADWRERRVRQAQPLLDEAKATAGTPPLDRVAARFDALAELMRTRWFGDEPSPLVDEATALATKFRQAATAVKAAFEPYERAVREGGLAGGDFGALDTLLRRSAQDAEADAALTKLLASLPPAGTRAAAVVERRDELRRTLVEAHAAAWERIRRDADERSSRRDYEGAAALVEAFAARSLDEERWRATEYADELRRAHQDEQSRLRNTADEFAVRFFEIVGSRDYARARDTLDELALLASTASTPVKPARDLVEGGRRLLDLIDLNVWAALRSELAKGGPLDQIRVRSGPGSGFQRYQNVRDVKVEGRAIAFTLEGGQRMTSSIDDVALDDVVRLARLAPTDPERALTLGAIRLLEYQLPSDPNEGIRVLNETTPLLEQARGSAELQPLVARLSKLRDDRVAAARHELQVSEDHASQKHAAAVAALNAGRYEEAHQQLQDLLDVKAYYRTDYVHRKREEIKRELDAAVRGRQTANYAAHFPGAAFTKAADGSGEVFLDFEDGALSSADGRKLLSLVEGRTEIDSRPAVIADHPDLVRPDGGARVPLVFEHVLAWRPAEGASSPRDFPVAIDCPFEQRKRIAVSLLVRSDAPFFFAVSIGGVTAGILSAMDNPTGGRGVEIWSAADLDHPDRAFDQKDERHRTGWLAKHLDVLKKEGDRRFFAFEPGRTYRVEFAKDERKASLWVDGQLRAESDWRMVSGALEGKVVLVSHGPAEVDDLRISGILDPEWLRGR